MRARMRGEKLCDLDLDGALHGRLHSKDEELQNRVFSVVYTLIRCGRISQACKLLENAGLSALVPSLKLRQLSRDPTLIPLSDEKSAAYLVRSRASFKRTVDKIVSKDRKAWHSYAQRVEAFQQ
ncbi:unnamed protein product [Gongylonema pulchrum]|uniref:Nuclear pore complex protein n=1 Tax=Gongylonema pulchrum TaxID=637853 RepID=A0A3P7RVA4_9BILA|nr:unnamed protein product [Gongylonema pulchrum]